MCSKVQSSDRIIPLEIFKRVFQSIVRNLNIPSSEEYDSLPENIDHPILTGSVKWKNHPSILAFLSEHKTFFPFI